MKFQSKHFLKGMTLWECLVSLIVMSMLMHALYTAILSYQHIIKANNQDFTADWELLVVLLQTELEQYEIVEVLPQELRIKNEKNEYRIMLSKNRIYKTPGFHPYAYHISDCYWFGDARHLTVTIEYSNGQIFSGVIKHDETD